MTELNHPKSHWFSREISAITAAICLVTASVVLAGLLYDMPSFLLLDGNRVSMKANTAIAFVLSSLAVLVATRRPSFLQSVARWGITTLIAVIALFTLIEYLLPLRISIDQLFVPAIDDALLTSSPGRMAPTTAIGFLVFAVAIMLDHWDGLGARVTRRALLAMLILMAIGAILGYAYGAPSLYMGIDGVTAMALSTAILFVILAIGGIWLRPTYGLPAILMEQSLLGANVRALVPMVVAAPLLVGAAVAAGYGRFYEGEFAIALTSLGSVMAATLIAIVSIVILRKSEAAMLIKDRALAATANGIVITDHQALNEPIVYINPAFTRITGYDEDELPGLNCRFLNHDLPGSKEIRAELRQCLSTGSSTTVELPNRCKDGTLFWNRLSISPIHGRDGTVTHFVGVIDDVTQRRQQQEQLHNALQETRKANSLRNTFVRLVSHELRTPLNAALTWIRLIEVDDREQTRLKGMRVIAESIESQSRLIDDLVDVTRYSGAGIRVEKARVDVRELTEKAVEEMRPTIEENQTLELTIADGDYTGSIDAGRYQQVVRNLLSNAHKYTPAAGHISVHLMLDQHAMTLRVTDTGKGLSPDEIENVFEPFWRAQSHQPGLGVGLAIVYSLVAAHGGTIDVVSKGHDQGSSFIVRFPREPFETKGDEDSSDVTTSTPPPS
ncbi:MAG: ATP-binding protein [Woeseia sp.]